MKIVRRPDGTHDVQVATWREFQDAWRAAPVEHRAVFDDGRPCVYRPARADEETGLLGASYLSPLPGLWALVRSRTKELVALREPRKRERNCAACGSAMTLTRELATVWVFHCAVCKAVEQFGKDVIGGTIGAGESEVPRAFPGVDVS